MNINKGRTMRRLLVGLSVVTAMGAMAAAADHVGLLPSFLTGDFPNADGQVRTTVDVATPVDVTTHPFWQAGPNGRSCATCHSPADAMSISATTIRAKFNASVTSGTLDPLFASIDGADCPNKTPGVEASHSMLLNHGAIRVARPWPPIDRNGNAIDPEFTIEVVSDPTGCNLDATYGVAGTRKEVSVYRRPRMAANLEFLLAGDNSGWSVKKGLPLDGGIDGPRLSGNLMADGRHPTLQDQAQDAFKAHMAGTTLSSTELAAIVEFESKVYTAQALTSDGASLPAVAGFMNAASAPRSVLGVAPGGPGAIFPDFENFDALIAAATTQPQRDFLTSAKRGYAIYKNKTFLIKDVANLNSIGIGNPVRNSCNTCHNHQNIGNDLAPGYMDLGVSNRPQAQALAAHGDYPLFKLTCRDNARPHPYLGRVIFTTDPGTALVSGKCDDIGSLNFQQLRGLAARAPYFTNGSAPDLRAVINYYDRRFNIGYTEQEIVDLVNFMKVL
jgi:cytochrome c peroxidase